MNFLCTTYSVSRSGYYAWRSRADSPRSIENKALVKQIQRIHDKSHGIYGSPRITAVLRHQGYAYSENRIARLMQENGIVGRIHNVDWCNTKLQKFYTKTINKSMITAEPTKINQVWVGDVTYIRHQKRWWYLAVVMDVYSRKVVGWALGQKRTVDLTLKALRNAIYRRQPKSGLIFHSDRGVEYASYRYQDVLDKYGIHASMNRPGHCTDNAHMESFFHSLKGEWIRGHKYTTVKSLRQAIKDYIVCFYNRIRLHSSLDYQSPEEFERLVA